MPGGNGMLSFLKVHAVKKKLEEVEAYLDQVLHFEHPEIREFALRTLHAGGKRVRPSLTILTASMFKNEDNIVPLAAAMELLHMASLIHDDVVDEADTRRGAATINVLKSNRYAIHVGDYILAEASLKNKCISANFYHNFILAEMHLPYSITFNHFSFSGSKKRKVALYISTKLHYPVCIKIGFLF